MNVTTSSYCLLIATAVLAGCDSKHSPSEIGAIQQPTEAVAAVAMIEPYVVNLPGNFAKSGFDGDATIPNVLVAMPNESNADGDCAGNRVAGARGSCDTFIYNPVDNGKGWAAVFYLSPADNNLGTLPGAPIASGAKEVAFHARASREVQLGFQAGLCNPANETQCPDGFFRIVSGADRNHNVAVSMDWQKFSIDLKGVDYSKGVVSAFSWVIRNDLIDNKAVTLYIDDIVWR